MASFAGLPGSGERRQKQIFCFSFDAKEKRISPYLVITSTGTLKILATFKMVSICRPTAAAI